MKQFRRMAAALCAVFLLCGFVIPAYAYADGGEGADYGDPTMTEETTTPEPESTPEPEPTVEPGEGFDQESDLVTRDLLYDKHTNKQFITVQTCGGSTFYIVIDYDKPVNEEEEQYQTYFLSTVDEDDLLAAIENTGGELPTCTCTEKCAAGAVNTDCPVCATNMTECAGIASEPEPTEPEGPEVQEPEPETGGGMGPILLILAVALVGGGAGWYFKVYRPKQERAVQAEEDYDEPDPYEEPEDYDPYGEDEYSDEEETEEKN